MRTVTIPIKFELKGLSSEMEGDMKVAPYLSIDRSIF